MKTIRLLAILPLFALAVDGSGATAPSASAANEPEAALAWAMPADAVRTIMGAPARVLPMKSPDGKAEVWVYQREVGVRLDRIPIASALIQVANLGADNSAHAQRYGGDTSAHAQVIGEGVQYTTVRHVTLQAVEVLMFNGHYVTHKVSSREVRHYEN